MEHVDQALSIHQSVQTSSGWVARGGRGLFVGVIILSEAWNNIRIALIEHLKSGCNDPFDPREWVGEMMSYEKYQEEHKKFPGAYDLSEEDVAGTAHKIVLAYIQRIPKQERRGLKPPQPRQWIVGRYSLSDQQVDDDSEQGEPIGEPDDIGTIPIEEGIAPVVEEETAPAAEEEIAPAAGSVASAYSVSASPAAPAAGSAASAAAAPAAGSVAAGSVACSAVSASAGGPASPPAPPPSEQSIGAVAAKTQGPPPEPSHRAAPPPHPPPILHCKDSRQLLLTWHHFLLTCCPWPRRPSHRRHQAARQHVRHGRRTTPSPSGLLSKNVRRRW